MKTKPALFLSLPSVRKARKAAQRARVEALKAKPGKARRKPVRRVSKSRAKELARYSILRGAFLWRFSLCQACSVYYPACVPFYAVEIHHRRGRSGKLLNATEYWLAVCNHCHARIHRHPAEARELGLLCEKGKWNTL